MKTNQPKQRVALVTGSAGLVGSETVRALCADGFKVIGVDNDLRAQFFGPDASTNWAAEMLQTELPDYEHQAIDIRDLDALERVFESHGNGISAVIHAAAQPSHDWAAREPLVDFSVNALGTANLLELTRKHVPEAVFVYTSTNKVYGDTPNRLPLEEQDSRWEIRSDHPFSRFGIDETMSIDQSQHSLFGASKAAGDLLVQEYGRYYGLSTTVFRAGCLTGSSHSPSENHGFLAYLMKCALKGNPYRVFGFGGKQVRDNLHAVDLVEAFRCVIASPQIGEVYNIGGGRDSSCSVVEAISKCEEVSGNRVQVEFLDRSRQADHLWWITDSRKFESHYPTWSRQYDLERILLELHDGLKRRY